MTQLPNGRQRRVVLQPEGKGKPLFVFPGIGGAPDTFCELAARLGSERPVIGFHLIGSLQECEPVRRVARLAQLYAAEVRGVQPRGPYYLFGYSFGGAIAFEVARELLSHGERVGLVAMLDCPAPGYPKPPPAFVRARSHLQNVLQLSARQRADYLRERVRNRVGKLKRLFGAEPEHDAPARPEAPHMQRVNAALYEAYANYRPAPLSVDVLFLTADTPPDWPTIVFDDPLMGWGPMLRGRITQCGVPGAHLSVFSPEHLPILISRLRAALTQAERSDQERSLSEIATTGVS